jgi:ABC-type nitrate/sulfonate/bicarbonate transport system substrate-binding protein
MRMARHLLGVAALTLAGCGATTGVDRPERDATLMLDGPPAAVHAGIASAVARGYDDAEGVRLKLRRAANGARALTTGDADLAVLDLHDLAGHPELVAVMAIVERPLLALIAPPAAQVGPRPWREKLLDALGRRPRGARLGRWDLAPATSTALHVEDLGEPVYPELVLCVARQTLVDSPGVVRATVAALTRGYRFTLTDPPSRAQDLKARFPGVDATPQLARLGSAFLGDQGRPGILDAAQIARWRRWAARHGLPSQVAIEPRYARAAASADEG